VLCGNRAPALEHLLTESQSSWCGYEIVALVATDPTCVDLPRAQAARVPAIVRDIGEFYRAAGVPRGELATRRAFDADTLECLLPLNPQVLLLCGYLHIVTEPLLEAFPQHVLNLHDADLVRRGADGRPRYRGLHATYDAICAGEPETRSSVHLVTADVDEGPLLRRSQPFPVHDLARDALAWGATTILRAYAFAQREWMMRASWGPLASSALRSLTLVGRPAERRVIGIGAQRW
jgi:folate-dependent phosphoribosylglycinamide formyltransferase PurN